MREALQGKVEAKLEPLLRQVYGSAAATHLLGRITGMIERWRPAMAPRRPWLDQSDAMLITYADTLQASGQTSGQVGDEAPLAVLRRFLVARAGDRLSAVHLLPFYPWTSDDGFSVVDYRAVDPAVGGWADVAALGRDFEPMLDAVINHASAESAWFQAFRRGEAPWRDWFIRCDPAADYRSVVRPRALPLLTEVETVDGPVHVWTTFSADQVDLNFAEPGL
ncbi:MAG: alpha-amylase family glycosyl hydrolase, partial [Geminicoccaceae bacterium]